MTTASLQLDSRNTHLPLRERVRAALTARNATEARAASLLQATPEQLNNANRLLGLWQHVAGNRQQYAEHVAALPQVKPMNLNSLASIGRQADDYAAELAAATGEIYGSVPPNAVTDAEVEAALRGYLAAKGQQYDPSR